MRSTLARISFTARLLAAAFAVMLALVAIDYVTLLELPERVARDSVEVALRENTQSFNAELGAERAQLQEAVDRITTNGDVRVAVVLDKDVAPLRDALAGAGIDAHVQLVNGDDLRAPSSTPGRGVVAYAPALTIRNDSQRVVVYRQIDSAALDRAAADAGNVVAFAVESGGRYVARSSGFPSTIDPSRLNASTEPRSHAITDVRVGDDRLHVYSRQLVQDSTYQVHALSTPALENDALRDTRSDVRRAIIGMTLATIIGLLLITAFTSRSVRRFATRVRALESGDFRQRLPVRGHDGFADLADSVNRLSSELDLRMTELRTTASAFRRTLETLEEGICTWSPTGDVVYWNRGAEQLTGVARERASLDDPVIAFLHAERTPGQRRVTLPVRRSGAGVVADIIVNPLADGGVLQTFRDSSLAESLQLTQRNFMATASHELRTPITTILGFADTLTNPELELTDPQREQFLDIIRDQSHHLQQIAEAFFTNYQLANERVEVSIQRVVVCDVVREAVERVRQSNPERAAWLTLETDVLVPDDLAVLADHRATAGIVAVLVENAVKYGREPITVSAEQTGGSVAILVRDEGPGIDPYHQNRVFDPFYRIDVDMRSGVGGAGLGLFTARKLVEAMHGVIRVRSTPGNGTTFVVELPVATDDAAAAPDAARDGTVAASPGPDQRAGDATSLRLVR